jgi:hypothetical protein
LCHPQMCFTARRPATPRPNTRFSRRRCAARNLAVVFSAVSCRRSPRPIEQAAARLSAIVGPPSARMALAERDRTPRPSCTLQIERRSFRTTATFMHISDRKTVSAPERL